MNQDNNRNLILAVVLTMAVLLGWQALVVDPEAERQRARQQAEQVAVGAQAPQPNLPAGTPQLPASQATPTPTRTPGVGAGTPGVAQTSTSASANAAPRILIDAPRVSGTISLQGLRFDDVVLKDYRITQEEDSPNIQLLQRTDSSLPYFAEFGWSSADAGQNMPNAQSLWRTRASVLEPGRPVALEWKNGKGLTFTRSISINDDYLITVEDRVESELDAPVTLFGYGLVRRHGTPRVSGFFILHEGPIGVFDETLREEDYDDLVDADGGILRVDTEQAGGWIGITDKYWLAALLPDQARRSNFAFKSLARSGGSDGRYQVDYIDSEGAVLQPGASISRSTHFFAGAKKVPLLDGYAKELNIPNFDLAVDFGWLYFLTKPFFHALNWLNGILGNFGLAIIVFTVIVKIVFYPLTNISYRSMAKMRILAPKIQALRERYGDDKQAMQREMMQLYRVEKVNPAAGCLPVLLQIPVFFALYKVLFVTIEMRHAPFYGWITDLSAPDPTSVFNLFGLLPYSVSFLPDFLQLGIWPILMGVSMFLQMRLNPTPPDPIQAKIFLYMPVFFTFILATFPAGLVIYWTWNNILSMAQQWYIMRRITQKG